MANLIDIDRNQLQRLNMNMRDFERDLLLVAREALKNLGQRIISDAQQTLRRRKNVATSLLINSGAVKEDGPISIKAGFPTMYAYYVEFGRRAGKWPPFRMIYEWVRIKHFTADEKEARRVAFLIQKGIGKKGTKPHPFLRPAYEKNKPLLIAILKKAAAKVMNKDYSR